MGVPPWQFGAEFPESKNSPSLTRVGTGLYEPDSIIPDYGESAFCSDYGNSVFYSLTSFVFYRNAFF